MSTEFTTMMSFSFTTQTPSIRTMLDLSGDPWFVAKDVCEILDIKNATQAVDRLDDDERAMSDIGLTGAINIINESGLFTLIIRSDKPQAKVFRKWVTSKVLPAIRKQGFYGSNGTITIPEDLEQVHALWPHLNRQLSYHNSRSKVLRDAVKTCMTWVMSNAPAYVIKHDPQPLLGGVLS